jgi:hypothetical protein
MPDHPILCVVSNARSGSTALRSVLAASGRIKDFGEIFHDDRRLTLLAFQNFLERRPDPLFAILDWDACVKLADAYLEQLAFESYGLKALIDIKHNAWGVLKPLWQFPHDEPLFLSALKARRTLFVQLKRDSLADQVISYIIANNTHIWHAQIRKADIPASLAGKRLDPVLVRRLCGLFLRAELLIEELLADYRHRLTLTYETTFADGVLTAEAAERLSGATGIAIAPAAPSQRPNEVDKCAVIANYDEVCDIAAAVRAAHTTGA